MPELFELIYTSRLAPNQSPACVADIVRTSRSFNLQHGITGLLVFDGGRFLQQLEGLKTQVLVLMEGIKIDPRHVDVRVSHQGYIERRRFPSWSIGYALDDESESLLDQALSIHGPGSGVFLERQVSSLDVQ